MKIEYKCRFCNRIIKRKEQILNSEVDLTKFGWVDKVSKITKLTRRQIARIVKLTDLKDVVYIRHMTEQVAGQNPAEGTKT